MTITGSVVDKSPGATQTEQAARFPGGLPCISDASMNDWMNYVYMQKPKPTNATGVEVTLTAIDPNHNYISLGTTTTDINGNYGFVWNTPQVDGTYQIIATFSGTNSYWGSSNTAYASLVSAPTASSTTTTVAGTSIADQYFIPAFVALLVVVIIGFALLYLALRKRP
jgi:hypothetical protein